MMDHTQLLPTFRLQPQIELAQADASPNPHVTVDSPAIKVMTDFRKVKPATIRRSASLLEAAQSMSLLEVHLLFVVDKMPLVLGLVTSSDLHGVKPMQMVQALQVRYNELTVSNVMTHLDKIDATDYYQLRTATVGDAIATLRHFGRNHLLVVEQTANQTTRRVRGLISRTQIERQLGEEIEITPTANSFAEIERALLHGPDT